MLMTPNDTITIPPPVLGADIADGPSELTPKMSARDVSVFYGSKPALKDVSIDIHDDRVTAFIATPPGGIVDPASVLPVQIFLWSDEVDRGFVEKTSAAIIVLLIFMLLMNGLAIYLRNRFERRW